MQRQATIRRSVTTVVLITTFVALLVNALALIALDIGEYRSSRLAEIRTQAQILLRASEAAVAFDDKREAGRALDLMREDPQIYSAAIYLPDGRRFAEYTRGPEELTPERATAPGFRFHGERITGFYTVLEGGRELGLVYLSAYYGLYDRLFRYLALLALVMVGAFGIAVLLSNALQRSVTGPILAVTAAARRVLESQDYAVRTPPQPGYETGLLADAFNQMLAEIHSRSDEVLRQMSEREAAQDALREADRRKDRFLATLAHELRNPLAPIVTSVQILKLKGGSDPDYVWARDVIDRQVRHMSRLLDDLLDVGRITNDKLELRRQRVTLASVVEAALESSRPLVERAGHALTVDLPRHALQLDVDPVRIAQVLSNLLTNAAKYTAPGGRIALTARAVADWVEITVEDNGIGVGSGDLPHLFDIFSQSGQAIPMSQGGLGIGLFLVKSLTEMHGGTVTAVSDGEGTGSRFMVRLPLASASVADEGHATAQAAPGGRARILIADDNRDAAEALAMMLRLDGHDVQTAFDGAEAIACAERLRPDVALVDIGMPVRDGHQVARAIRSTAWGRDILLVAITGWGKDEDRRSAFEAGFDHHLTKPARYEDLQAILREHFSGVPTP